MQKASLPKLLYGTAWKKEKTADDWAEIAMLSYKLGEYQKASEAALKAHEMDPVREDLSQLYFTFHSIQKN